MSNPVFKGVAYKTKFTTSVQVRLTPCLAELILFPCYVASPKLLLALVDHTDPELSIACLHCRQTFRGNTTPQKFCYLVLDRCYQHHGASLSS